MRLDRDHIKTILNERIDEVVESHPGFLENINEDLIFNIIIDIVEELNQEDCQSG